MLLHWFQREQPRLGAGVVEAIRSRKSEVHVSAASLWEIEIKRALGKLDAPLDLIQAVAGSRLRPLSITPQHGIAAGRLPPHHHDPFDRMLVAQAQLEGLTLVTGDERLRRYEVAILAATP